MFQLAKDEPDIMLLHGIFRIATEQNVQLHQVTVFRPVKESEQQLADSDPSIRVKEVFKAIRQFPYVIPGLAWCIKEK